jgi:hypothetical protein
MEPRGDFELRLTTPSGGTLRVGPIATHAEADALARSYLGQGWAIRVEVFGRRRGRYEVYGVIEQPKRPPTEPEDAVVDVGDDVLDVGDDDVLDVEDE